MTKEQQGLAWACLTKGMRQVCRNLYNTSGDGNVNYLLDELFHHNNLTSDTEPEEMLMVSRIEVQEAYKAVVSDMRRSVLFELFGDKCLPDEEQPKPKFDKGDLVRCSLDGMIYEVEEPCGMNHYCLKGRGNVVNIDWLEPYTEENEERMEEIGVNLYELLKGCEGEWFYSLNSGNVEYQGTNHNNTLLFIDVEAGNQVCVTPRGFGSYGNGDVCLIYPSRDLYKKYPLDPVKAWAEWEEARKPKRWRAENGKRYWVVGSICEPVSYQETNVPFDDDCYEADNYFRTYEEAKQAAEVVREALAKFHEQKGE